MTAARVVVAMALVLAALPVRAAPITLNDCISRALERAPLLHAAAADVTAARAATRGALAAYSPRLRAHAEYGVSGGYDEAVTNGGSTMAVVSAEAILLDGGRRDAELAAARQRLRSASARQQQQRADVAHAVRIAYAQALAARAQQQIHAHGLQTLRDAVALLQRQQTLGFVPANDVLRARLATDSAAAARRSASASLDTALSRLEILSGISLSAASLAEAQAALLRDTASRIDQSPLITDVRATAEAARRDADSARSERRPQVTLTGSGGAVGVRPGTTFRDNGGGDFLVGVTLPLFDGGSINARVAAAEATAARAEADLAALRQSMTVQIDAADIAARRAADDLAAWQRSVPTAEDNLSLMRARYFGGGNVRLLEVLDALTQLVDARLGVVQARLDYQVAVATQQQLLGEVGP